MDMVPPGGAYLQRLGENWATEALPEGVVWGLSGPSDWDAACPGE